MWRLRATWIRATRLLETDARKECQGRRMSRKDRTFTTVCPCRCGKVKSLPAPTLQAEEREASPYGGRLVIKRRSARVRRG